MKKWTFILILLICTSGFAQEIKTKDGLSMGERSEFIAICEESAAEQMMNINGVQFESYRYCACVCDKLIPELYSWEIMEAAEEDKIMELFMNETNLAIIMNCLEDNVQIGNDFVFESSLATEQQKELAVEACVMEIMNTPDLTDMWSRETARNYCQCAIDKLLTSGYSYKDLMEAENEDSPVYNEIVIPCLQEAMLELLEVESNNSYVEEDIIGTSESSVVSLINYLGSGYKIKIIIAGKPKYYLFDTGASDLFIDRETERELLLDGIIQREDYLEMKTYIMADNTPVEAQLVRIDGVTIGDYTVNNVVVAIMDGGSLLCGKSLLDKFRKWEFDGASQTLILYK